MRALVQRVSEARVTVDGRVLGAVYLRIFRDAEGRKNRSLLDVGRAALIDSQFTLAAETRGNRPGFSTAAAPDEGERLYVHFAAEVRGHGVPVATGRFGADMQVGLTNDGPVTIWLDTAGG
jgi:D-tyrosyl-tRNA(Tyr) deacylase